MGEIIAIRSLYREPERHLGRTVDVVGWVRTVRDQKRFGFIELNDGSFFRSLQVVYQADGTANADLAARLGSGSAIRVTGRLVATPEAPQPIELQALSVDLEGECPPDYPLQPKRHSPEFLRTLAHLRPRTNLFSAVFRVRSVAAFAIHRFFQERGFVHVHTPIITASDCEGAGQMFSVTTLDPEAPPRSEDGRVDFRRDFFGRQARLTVSGQLNAEAFCLAFGKVYTFGPTFRAERSNTTRHAAEFWMIEPEIAFADLRDNMRLAEDLLKDLIRSVLAECPEEMEFFGRFVDKGLMQRLAGVADSRFAVISYTDAVAELEKVRDRFAYPVSWGVDLQTEHERFLTEALFRCPVFVVDYPKEIKAFYMRLTDDGRTVAAMDCLVPGVGEIVGGSQREERQDVLQGRLADMGLREEDYGWYLDLRRFGGTRHAGFGLGFERALMYLTGVSNIRDVLPFPRTCGDAAF